MQDLEYESDADSEDDPEDGPRAHSVTERADESATGSATESAATEPVAAESATVSDATAEQAPDRRVVEFTSGSTDARVHVPPDADEAEVAAIISAIATRLREEAAEAPDESAETDRWRLAGRLGARRRFELPRRCRRGGEWQAASRCP